ncbi:hypothetical protein EDD22DRAFT_326524 [Suillus occidentalis]|nr:hypothetical protein EDD22DRAFT_326524 [Suillus occidentalis]
MPSLLIGERDGDKCAVTGAFNIYKKYLLDDQKQRLFFNHQAAVVAQLIVLQRTMKTIDIIKHHTKLPDNLASIIDNPENPVILDVIIHDLFDSYKWCLLPTDILHKYTVHWFCRVPAGLGDFTKVQFQNHPQTGIRLPNPTFITLHAAVAHVSHLSDAAGIIDKVYDAFSD